MDIDVFLFLLLAVAVVTDLQSDKIPNWLILIGLVVGIWMTDHLIESISVCIFIILILFPLFHIGALGAGDIKCIAMISFYLSIEQLFMSMFYALSLAAAFSVCRMLYNHSFAQRKSKIHLALPIFLGVLTSVGGTYL